MNSMRLDTVIVYLSFSLASSYWEEFCDGGLAGHGQVFFNHYDKLGPCEIEIEPKGLPS